MNRPTVVILLVLLLTSLTANGLLFGRALTHARPEPTWEGKHARVRAWRRETGAEAAEEATDQTGKGTPPAAVPAWIDDRTALNLKPARKARSKDAVDVVLVVIDTARADFLEPYNSRFPTSPFLSAVAREGVTFTNAYSTAGWTVPAMYSMMTGLYPSEHGGVSMTTPDRKAFRQPVLPEEAVTLAELLKQHGYSTFGVCTNLHLGAGFGFAQGYDAFAGDNFAFKPFPQVSVDSMSDRIQASAKYFLWLHYFDAHYPYFERAPWFYRWNKSAFSSIDELGVDAAKAVYRTTRHLPPGSGVPPQDIPVLTNIVYSFYQNPFLLSSSISLMKDGPGGEGPGADYIEYLQAVYASELRSIDHDMERLLEGLGIDDRTLIIVTADHGEELFDHGDLGHRMESLYQELIRIPLVIRLPGSRNRGRVIDTPVSIIDLLPSLLDLLALPVPEDLSGQSFARLIEGETGSEERQIISELTLPGVGDVRSLIQFPWKYIYHFHDGRGELYNMETDPRERNDLASEEPVLAQRMREGLVEWASRTQLRWREPSAVQLTAEQIKKLGALGYIMAFDQGQSGARRY